MYTVKEIMSDDVVSVRSDTPIYEAMRLLVKHNITGLPVVDENNRIQGVITEKDMLRLLYDPNIDVKKHTVVDYMSRDPICYNEEDDLVEVCECLMSHHFRRIPILSEEKITGIISRKDIIHFILKLRKEDRDI